MSAATITLLFLLFAVVMFVFEKIPLGVTSMIVCIGLVVTGVLDIKTAFAGFIDSNVILFVGDGDAMTALMTELGADRQKFRSKRVEMKIEAAMRDGVIVPAMKDWATALCSSDEAAFDGFVASVGTPFASLFKTVITPEMEAKLTPPAE